MKLSEVCIDRPVFATVLSLLVVLFGALGLTRLTNRELPDVDPPVVSVTTVYPGAAPGVVETSVTRPLEDELMGIEGIRHLTSESREQVSAITVEFELYREVEVAANDVRDRVARALAKLPEEIEDPVVSKRDADAFPVLWIALTGEHHDAIQLTMLAETGIQDRLSKLPGVATVILAGDRRHAMRIWIDNHRLGAHRLTVTEVADALRRQNVEVPSGRVESVDREFTVRTIGELQTAEAFERLVIGSVDGSPVRLGDVARVETGPESERKIVRFNGLPAVALGVVKTSKANTIDVVDAARAELDALEDQLPDGVEMRTAFDSSLFVRRAVRDVTLSIGHAVVLVVVVIYLFLRRVRSTLIPAASVPISLVGCCALLYFFGFSLNTLTLMAMTLAIGLVVDDAIVVLENIARWVEEGHDSLVAARRGMEEISFAVVATTLSVIAVFVPLAFLTDQTGRLFREFGVTVAGAVAISGLVSLTLSPMLAARVLGRPGPEGPLKRLLARALQGLSDGYGRALGVVLRRRGLALAVGAGWFAVGIGLLALVPSEFVPDGDRGTILVFTRAPEGSTIEFTGRYQREVERAVMAKPEVDRVFSILALGIGAPGPVNEGAIFATMVPWEERERSQQDIVDELDDELWEIAGLEAFPTNPSPLGRFRSTPVSLVLRGPDVEALAGYADQIAQRTRALPGFKNVRTDLVLNKPQLDVDVDRERAGDLGVSVRDIATTLQVLLGGLDVSTFKLEGETYNVIAQLERPARSQPRDLLRLYVRARDGGLVPLASMVELRESASPRALPHFDRQRAATLQAGLEPGVSLGDALDRVRSLAEQVLPAGQGYRVSFSGESEDFYASGNALAFAYVLAVAMIYLLLAAQFESFVQPLVILIAVALSFTGALVALLATGTTLNLFSQIGMVMLVGLVTKNSILIVEFANRLRERGRGVVEAAREASRLRLRPILMTSIATIAGILPIALGSGAGGEARAPLGIAVVGGLFFSSALTIFVVPAAWSLVEGARGRFARRVPAPALAD